MNYSSQQYEQFMISVSNAFKELYNQISRFDSLCLRLQMIPKDTSDALSMQFTLHTIAVVAGLSSNDAQANMDKAFLCDIKIFFTCTGALKLRNKYEPDEHIINTVPTMYI